MKETFGEYIHKLRSDSGMTLTKLAAALDIDQSTLSKIENGKRNIPVEILPKLSTVFNLDLKQLEHEYFSEKIAEIIYPQDEPSQLLKAAEEKAKYMKIRNLKQTQKNAFEHLGKFSFEGAEGAAGENFFRAVSFRPSGRKEGTPCRTQPTTSSSTARPSRPCST